MQGFPQHRLTLLQEPTAIVANEVQEIQDVFAETTRCELQNMPLRKMRRQHCIQDQLLLLQNLQKRILLELPWEGAQGRVCFKGYGCNAVEIGIAEMPKMQVLYIKESRMRSHEMHLRV